jgi:hypothetical protein
MVHFSAKWTRQTVNVKHEMRVTQQEVITITDRLLSSDATLAAQKTMHPTILHCRGDVFAEQMPSNGKGIHRLVESLWYDTDRIGSDSCNNYSIVAFICCRGDVFAEPLFSNDRGHTHRPTDWCDGFMNYAVEMGSSVMIYINKFYKDWFSKLSHKHTFTCSK